MLKVHVQKKQPFNKIQVFVLSIVKKLGKLHVQIYKNDTGMRQNMLVFPPNGTNTETTASYSKL